MLHSQKVFIHNSQNDEHRKHSPRKKGYMPEKSTLKIQWGVILNDTFSSSNGYYLQNKLPPWAENSSYTKRNKAIGGENNKWI